MPSPVVWNRSSITSKICSSLADDVRLPAGSRTCLSEDFLHISEWIPFQRQYLRDSGRQRDVPAVSRFFKVIAPIMEAQLVETAILNIHEPSEPDRDKSSPCLSMRHRDDGVMEFGLRRAQGPDSRYFTVPAPL